MNYEDILSLMKSRYRELAGFDADDASDVGIRLKVLASELEALYERTESLRREVFPQTSGGEALELHAATRGLSRKPAIPARGKLRFCRETPALSDIPIPAGALCSTRPDPQVHFETTAEATLKAGETFADVPAKAVEAGGAGNVAANSVCTMVSPVAAVSSVYNPAPFSGGVDGEADDDLRDRLLMAYQNISNGTNGAFYYDLAMGREGVASANILPRRRGRGTVDVVVTCRDETIQAGIVAAIGEELERRKEINVDVLVTAAVKDRPAVSVEIAVKDGYTFSIVAEKVKAAIEKHLDELPVGRSLLLATLGSKILAVDGVYNYRIVTPAKDVLPASDHVIRAGSVAIDGMAVG